MSNRRSVKGSFNKKFLMLVRELISVINESKITFHNSENKFI